MMLPVNVKCVWITINAQAAAINSFPTTALYIPLYNPYYNLHTYNHQMFSTYPTSLLLYRSRKEKNVYDISLQSSDTKQITTYNGCQL
jgi:hypothetical protein